MKPVTITSLELENVKRVKAVFLAPSKTGLTVIGGKNAQGKTSILDAITYGLGGEKYRPTNLQREGGLEEASIDILLSNGLRAIRKGKNASLKIVDPDGKKSGQAVLDSFIETLALDLPKFLSMSDDQKAIVLLNTLGIGEDLKRLDEKERAAYEKRHALGAVADQKLKFWRELPEHHDAPEALVSAADLIRKAEAVMARNGLRAAARKKIEAAQRDLDDAAKAVTRLEDQLEAAIATRDRATAAYELARSVPETAEESTAAIQAEIASMEETNAKVRANMAKAAAKDDSDEYARRYAILTAAVEDVREERRALLAGASMPLEDLTIGKTDKDRPCLIYKGQPWDCMSGMERVRVAVSIVKQLKPDCGFVLLDKLESFDLVELAEFGQWLETQGLQAIATRVSDGDECAVIIEDGTIIKSNQEGNLF